MFVTSQFVPGKTNPVVGKSKCGSWSQIVLLLAHCCREWHPHTMATFHPSSLPFEASRTCHGTTETSRYSRHRCTTQRLRIIGFEAFAVIQNGLTKPLKSVGPLLHGENALPVWVGIDLDYALFLIDAGIELVVKDQKTDDILHLSIGDVEFLGKRAETEARVWSNELENATSTKSPCGPRQYSLQ